MKSIESQPFRFGMSIKLFAALALCVLAAGCSQVREIHRADDPGLWNADGTQVAKASAEQRRQEAAEAAAEENIDSNSAAETSNERTQPLIAKGSEIPALRTVAVTVDQDFVPVLDGEPISGSYNNIPLPAFINLVFGEQLGLPFSLDSAIQAQSDLVTLRLMDPVEPRELYLIARRTLRDYGVVIRFDQNIFTFSIDKNISASDVPILVTGRALPEVPESHRPVFVFVPLESVKPARIRNWLRSAMAGQDMNIQEDPTRNAMILSGKPEVIEQALAMIQVLDQPNMRGKYSLTIEPAFARVEDLAEDLVSVLQAEGYDASTRPPMSAILVLPLRSSNQLAVFAASQKVIDHVESWARKIDRRQQLAVEDGIFSYEVDNTEASYIVDLLNELSFGTDKSSEPLLVGAAGSPVQRPTPSNRSSAFVVDTNRNAIIFRGSGKQWSELLPVIKQMDQLSPSVLVEVLLAEITLTDTDSSSFQFLATTTINDYGLSYGTLGGLIDSGSSSFSAVLDKAGETRAILKVLYENRRAEIRSRPRLMVKSGQTATIDVGNEIPVLTTASQSTTNPDAPIVQDVVYRNTGVRLQIRPTVHNSGYVDIEVDQELSEAQVNETSGIDSPTIRNRSLNTTVTLRDGGSILLGGLIANTTSDNEVGVPVLGAIPGVGTLFRSDGVVEERQELVIMIIPYVMDRPRDAELLAEELTDALLINSTASFESP